ncbi:MAG: serine/threonine-protein kinase [Planctomycetes bacterium]|nr:serine/threonine-protein kinase [Planctomycetota bacterium]
MTGVSAVGRPGPSPDDDDGGDAGPDEALLDGVLAGFIADLAAGREPDVAAAAPGRPDLNDRVAEMLAIAREVSPGRALPAAAPLQIAGHDILREIGRGGMGHVYLARDRRLGRTVALKVLPQRLTGPRSKDRFLREARAIARLSHPLIVPIHGIGDGLDGDDGQPWFSMAYVDGCTLGQAIASARTSGEIAARDGSTFARSARVAGEVPERWRKSWARAVAHVALDVAEALAHAHANGVVHRDVKPSNVMLRPDGFALLLDFGLAAVEDEGSLTLSRGFLGTPHYASPEQAAGGTDSLDGRSDVFSLGATLYEALTLQFPFPGPTPHEVLRRVQTWEPVPPSKIAADVPADLETIVLCALEKDRTKRYASAAALAADLRAFLGGRKVKARRAGVLERGLRLVKRNRALTEILVEQQARNEELRSAVLRAERNEAEAQAAREESERSRREADAQRARAEAERDTANDVVSFLTQLLGTADPSTGDRNVRVADVLARAETDVLRDFAGRPAVVAEILGKISAVHYGLGRFADSRRTGEACIEASARAHGPDARAALEAQVYQLTVLFDGGDRAEAERRARALAATIERTAEPGGELWFSFTSVMSRIANAAGRFEESEALSRDLLERATTKLGPDHADTVTTLANLAQAIRNRDRSSPEALALLQQVFDVRCRTLGARHPRTNVARVNLATSLTDRGDPRAAEALLAEALAISQEVLGPEHKSTLITAAHRVTALTACRCFAEAASLARDCMATWKRVYGESDSTVCALGCRLGNALVGCGDDVAAADAYADVIRIAEAFGAAGDDDRCAALVRLSAIRAAAGRLDEAVAFAGGALDTMTSRGWLGRPAWRQGLQRTAAILSSAGRIEDAAVVRERLSV